MQPLCSVIWCQCVFVSPPLWGLLSTHMNAYQRRGRLRQVDQWPGSNGSFVSCIYAAQDFTGLIYDVWWGGPVILSPLIASIRSGIFDLLHLGLGRYEEPPLLWRGAVWLSLLCKTGLSALIPQMMIMLESIQGFLLNAYVSEWCAPSVPVSRLLGQSVFGNSFGHVDDATRENIQEVISLVIIQVLIGARIRVFRLTKSPYT